MTRIVLILCVLCLPLVWLVPAGALPASVTASIPRARRYWGPLPCGHLRIGVSPFHLPQPGNGLSFVGETFERRCLIVLNSAFVAGDPQWLVCEAVLHEWGHLMGRGHSPNPRSIMFYVLGRRHRPCAGMPGT